MAITSTVTAAPTRLFTTVEALQKRVDTGAMSSEILAQDIEAWSLRLEADIGRVLAQERVQQTDYGSNLGLIVLERQPVIAIHSVTIDGVAVESTRYHLDDPGAGILRIDNTQGIYLHLLGDRSYGLADNGPRGERYVVEYTGGYVLPGWPADPYGARTLPLDIELAVIDAMRFELEQPAVSRNGVVSERLGDWAASYSAEGRSVTPRFMQVAEKYRAAI